MRLCSLHSASFSATLLFARELGWRPSSPLLLLLLLLQGCAGAEHVSG
jgi:hypothetical protein